MDFYGVYYYRQSFSGARVYVLGFYKELAEATKRLEDKIGKYSPHINKTVHSGPFIGWINEYKYGDINSDLTCCQPYSSVNLFN